MGECGRPQCEAAQQSKEQGFPKSSSQAAVLWEVEEKPVLYLEGLATRWHQGVSTGSLFLYLREEGAVLTFVSEGQRPEIVLCLREEAEVCAHGSQKEDWGLGPWV